MAGKYGAAITVTEAEIEASLQKIARGEGNFDDANLLRSIMQRLRGIIQPYEEIISPLNQGNEINAHNQSIQKAM